MNAHTLAAREQVFVIRESLCVAGPNVLQAELENALAHLRNAEGVYEDHDYASIELWARLAADIAALLQRPI